MDASTVDSTLGPAEKPPSEQAAPAAGAGAAEALRRQINLRWGRYARAYQRLRAPKPTGEGIHALRVAGRRLRVALRLLESMAHPRQARALRQRLQATARRLGPLRDCDVHAGMLQALARRHPTLRPVLQGLRRQRARGMARLGEYLPARRLAAQQRRLMRLLRALQAQDAPREAALSAALVTRLARDQARVLRALERAQDGDPRHLHLLRIACKGFRYSLELALALGAHPGGNAALAQAKSWQGALGNVQDWSTLEQRLLRYASRHPGVLAPPAVQAVTRRRQAAAQAVLRKARHLPALVERAVRQANARWEH